MKINPLIRKRKSPTQPRAQATVDAIMEATAQLLERDGEASTNRIARRAGVSIGTIYQYFPNGAAIVGAIAERERAKVGEALKAALSELDPDRPQDAIRQALRTLLGAFRKRQKLRRTILLTLMPHYSRAFEGRLMDELSAEMIAIFNDRMDGRIRPLDETGGFVLSRAILGAVRSAVLEDSRDLTDPRFEDELVRLTTAFLFADDIAAG